MMVAPLCCAVCGDIESALKDGLESVRFADYGTPWTPPEWDDCGLTHNSMGVHGPEGLGWFCSAHLDGAMRLRRLNQAEAVARLQKDADTVARRKRQATTIIADIPHP
jgi:hypothetical protein